MFGVYILFCYRLIINNLVDVVVVVEVVSQQVKGEFHPSVWGSMQWMWSLSSL